MFSDSVISQDGCRYKAAVKLPIIQEQLKTKNRSNQVHMEMVFMGQVPNLCQKGMLRFCLITLFNTKKNNEMQYSVKENKYIYVHKETD